MALLNTLPTPGDPKILSSSTKCKRRRVVGVDIWVESPLDSEQVIYRAHEAASCTHLRLTAAFNGTETNGSARGNEFARLRLRFLARQDDVHLTDEAIFELMNRLSTQIRWSDLVKLEEFDGIPDFVPLPH
ncbi:MAG: hypothetical protein M1131_06900 [Actinobacteria bacterium]|nr:hypothetical protein [Actinomycetota bacterium]MCL6095594.1 hypothetical protein [Actinomycetota bacterium]